MDVSDLLPRFAVALGIGLLIGLERGWRTREAGTGMRTAGIRTFAITGLLGGIVGALAQAAGGTASAGGGLLLGLGFAAYAGVMALFFREENIAHQGFSATTAVAAMTTFALGALALLGDMRLAAAVAVAVAVLLAMRQPLHGWVERITEAELRSALILLTMTFIALPIVPEGPFGPFGGINPREVWLIAIVLAGISFAGYAAVKYFGARHGVLLAAAAGGLVSSTAVTAANARCAAAGEGEPLLLAAGVALATAISFLRVMAIVAVLKPALLPLLAAPLLAATAVAGGFAIAATFRRGQPHREEMAVTFRNPFGFWAVIGFAVFLGAIIMLGRWLGETLGAVGLVAASAALGLADVDAVTVSMSRLVPEPLTGADATLAILAAVAVNTLSKVVIGASAGTRPFALWVAAVLAACVLAAAVVVAAMLWRLR